MNTWKKLTTFVLVGGLIGAFSGTAMAADDPTIRGETASSLWAR